MPNIKEAVSDNKIELITNKMNNLCGRILLVSMCFLIILLGVNIFLRYLFDSPIAWSNTISRYIYIIIALVGSAIAYTQQGHARIDILYNRVGPTTRKVFDLIHCVIMMALCIIFFVVGGEHVATMWPVNPPIIPWLPVGSIYLAIPVFSLLIFFYLLSKIISIFNKRSVS